MATYQCVQQDRAIVCTIKIFPSWDKTGVHKRKSGTLSKLHTVQLPAGCPPKLFLTSPDELLGI